MTIALHDGRHPPTKGVSSFTSIGVDLGKEVFHIVGFDRGGKMVLNKQIRRFALEQGLAKLPPSIVGMEACLSAHFVSRTLRRLGRTPPGHPGTLREAICEGSEERLRQ